MLASPAAAIVSADRPDFSRSATCWGSSRWGAAVPLLPTSALLSVLGVLPTIMEESFRFLLPPSRPSDHAPRVVTLPVRASPAPEAPRKAQNLQSRPGG